MWTGAAMSSGVLVAIGLLEPVGAALMVSVMIVAASVHWQHGLFRRQPIIPRGEARSPNVGAWAVTSWNACRPR
jgi:uncharacterized membrane protein YphA (DoxX/SURF4 family)